MKVQENALLKKRENEETKRIIRLRCGLDDGELKAYSQIKEIMGLICTTESIRQQVLTALSKIRRLPNVLEDNNPFLIQGEKNTSRLKKKYLQLFMIFLQIIIHN